MTKKLRIVVMLFILAFSFSVKATVLLEVDCNGTDIAENKNVVCEGTLLYEKEGINDIEFDYQTNLNIEFLDVSGFTMNNSNGKVSIHTDKALYSKILSATPIMKFVLSTNEKVGENEKLTINNILINKSNNIKVDGFSRNFNVTKLVVKQDNVCTLDNITIDKEPLKDFNKDKFEYRGITVTNEVVFIDAVRTSDKSSATGLGDVRVPKGETIERKITVSAVDGTTNIYKLYITNITTKENIIEFSYPDTVGGSDNTLKLLELYNGRNKIDIGFEKEKEIYNIDIEEEVSNLTIKATLNDSKASFVNSYGPRDIKINYGYNRELIKIHSENGSERIITLNINYHDNRVKDNSLLSLKVNNQVLDLSSDKLEVRLPYNTNKTIIEAIPNSDKATVKYEDIDLLLGDNSVSVIVIAESGDTKVYNINVIRENEIKILDSITIVGYDLNFEKSKINYYLKIPKRTNNLNIVVNPNNIEYEVLYNSNLQNGSKVLIKVIDDNGTYEYTINIIKDKYLSNSVCYSVFGIGIVSIITSIVHVFKKKNKTH